MVNLRKHPARFVCEVVLSALTVAIGIGLVTVICDIYFGANGSVVYSRAIVGEKLKGFIAPLVIWAASVIACYVLSLVYPESPLKKLPSRREKVSSLIRRIPDGKSPEFLVEYGLFKNFEIGRIVIYAVATAFSIATAIYAIVYLAIPHFTSDINGSMLEMGKRLLPMVLVCFLLFIGAVIYEFATAKAETECLKKMFILGKGEPVRKNWFDRGISHVNRGVKKAEKWIVLGLRVSVGIVAVVLLGLGIANGGWKDMLEKAIKICTECIGLG